MKTNIIIAGIGGVGGYFGGMLAKCFEGDEDVNMCFLSLGGAFVGDAGEWTAGDQRGK